MQKFVLVQPEKSSILSDYFDFGMEMNRDDYRELIAEIEYCQHEQYKLALILENIHTLSDIDNILIDVKLADETIILILNKITEEEFIALLANYLIYEDEIHQIAQILFNYLETFDYEKQKRIRQKALHIQGEFITCNSKK